MPYISKDARARLERTLHPTSPGELNYVITLMLKNYIESRGQGYAPINDAIGVLECAKMELYRRVAVPFEDKKMKENGDVYK